MRSTILKTLVLGLTAISVTGMSHVAQAQSPIRLIEWTNSWKFLTNRSNQGTGWITNGFNDGSWPSGRGLFGFETTPAEYTGTAPFNTPFGDPQANPPASFYTNVYFRTHFNLPISPNGVTLIASNYIDDGAVIYLNGVEIGRFNVPSNQTYMTFASGGPAAEGQFDVINYTNAAGLLKQGDNVIAAEVHQINYTSSDFVWGMSLTAIPPTCPTITRQPQSITNSQSQPTTFSVVATGTSPTYQWQKNNGSGVFTNIPSAQGNGATTANYMIASTQPTNAGSYRVIISNIVCVVTSSVATLTVVADLDPPALVSAVAEDYTPGPGLTNVIFVTFSESIILSNATNVANYSLTSVPAGSRLIISNATLNGNVVRLRVSAWDTDTNYVLTVNNIRDRSANANIIPPNSQIGVALWHDVLSLYETWKFREVATTPTNNPSANNWTSLNYVEKPAEWFSGAGPLGYEFFSKTPVPIATALDYGFNAYYFRIGFDLGTNVASVASIKLNYLIDDGAVFYLNGTELFRYNMPAGPVDYDTLATGGTDATNILTTDEITFSNLSRTNVLSVEVHQQAGDAQDPNQTDVVFDAGLRIAYALYVAPALPPPRLTITRQSPTNNIAIVSWDTNRATGYSLQTSTNASTNGPWSTVLSTLGTTPAYTNSMTGPRRYYRAQKP